MVLSNADFVMSKIASDEQHGGNKMRKMVDYFCRLLVDKSFHKHIVDNDTNFTESNYYKGIKWIASNNDDLYCPDYIDMLRVAFTFKFSRGKFSDLVALLSGRNFETRTYEDEIAAASYQKLSDGLEAFVNQTNYQRFVMILQSTGLISRKLISSQNSINFAYALYLKLRDEGMSEPEIQGYVKRWLILSIFIGRYSGSAESRIDEDIKQINEKGIAAYLLQMEQAHLGEGFWDFGLINDLESSSVNNNAYTLYLAAQVNSNSVAFLSKSMTITSLIEQRGDIHHIFPKQYLINNGYPQKAYNQVANFVYTEQATNIKVGKMPPTEYLRKIEEQINEGVNEISTLDADSALEENIKTNDIPSFITEATHQNYNTFLEERRKMMSKKLKAYYENL